VTAGRSKGLSNVLKLPENLSDLLAFDPETLVVTGREGKRREFKLDYFQKDISDYTKTLAAFANADGGFIIFGVRDRPREIVGVKEVIDEAKWADRLREDFAPEVVFATRTYEIAGKILLAIGTDSSPHRPIIARTNRSKKLADKDGKPVVTEAIRDGTIYYRYGGQTRPIGYSELSEMLADRERNRIKSMMESLKVVEKIGIQNVGIVDMKQGTASHLYLSKETARGLSFIDRGRFVEEEGAPAYVVLGNVDLNQVIHRPLEEEDKNLTTEAAKQIKPILKKIYGFDIPFSPQQVSQVLRHLGVLDDNTHSIWEKKLRRRYITRAGIKAAVAFITAKPLEAVRAFGSKAVIAQVEAGFKPPEPLVHLG
jgi:Putative DNA-binding domain